MWTASARHPLRAGRRKLGAARAGAAALGKYLAYKGSITVNGVSLTVNRVTDRRRRLRIQHQPDPAHRGKHRPGHLKAGSP
jgi:riboflavin synthase alpha subunit